MHLSQLTREKVQELGSMFENLLKETVSQPKIESLMMDTALPYGTIPLCQQVPVPDFVSLPFYAQMRIVDEGVLKPKAISPKEEKAISPKEEEKNNIDQGSD